MSDDPRPAETSIEVDPLGNDGNDGTAAERRDSKTLMAALTQRKDVLGAAAQLPPEDHALSERILGEARRRSEQISASRNPAASTHIAPVSEGIAWWIYAAWGVAILASILAFRYLL